MLCLLLSFGVSAIHAQTYIKEVAVCGSKSASEAKQRLKEEGYIVIDVDMTSGKGRKIYIGYKTTETYSEAITNLLIMNGKDYSGQNHTVKYLENYYKPAKVIQCGDFNGDLNQSAGGDYLYLYYTKEELSQTAQARHGKGVITEINVLYYSDKKSSSDWTPMYNGKSTYGDPDCNRKAGGKYIYIRPSKKEYSAGLELFSEDFKVTHLGGRLYLMDMPVGRYNPNDDKIYTITSNSVSVNLNPESDQMTSQFSIGNNSMTKSDMSKAWNCVSSGKGKYIDISTMESRAFTNVAYPNQIPALFGDNSNVKSVKFLWLAPEEVGENTLRFLFDVSIKREGGTTTNDKMTITPSYANSSQEDLMVVDPFVDYDNNLPGRAQLIITATTPAQSCMVWDATDNKVIMMETYDAKNAKRSFDVSLAPHDDMHEISVITFGKKTFYQDNGASYKAYDVFSAKVRQQPFHSVKNATASAVIFDMDSMGIAHRYPMLDWDIVNPKESDLLDADQFIVERSFDKDFTNAVVVASLSFSDTIYSYTKDGQQYGRFRIIDDSYVPNENAAKESVDYWDRYPELRMHNKYDRRLVYYRLSRAFVHNSWGYDEEFKDFQAEWTSYSDDILPYPTSITVTKYDDWETTHHVRLTVKLENPYPWENEGVELVGLEDVCKNKSYSIGDTARMFIWDPNANITISRESALSDHYQGKDDAEKTLVISGRNVKWNAAEGCYYAQVDDYQSLPYVHYYYQAKVDASNSVFPVFESMNSKKTTDGEAESCYHTNMSLIQNFHATLGSEIDKNIVEWEMGAGMVPELTLIRYDYTYSSLADSVTIPIGTMGSVIDNDVDPGKVYLYKLSGKLSYRGKDYPLSETTLGYPSRIGRISGHVQMPNGCNVPGGATVSVERLPKDESTLISFPQLQYKDIVVPGFSQAEFQYTVPVNADGSFVIDSIPYEASGWNYQVTPDYHGMAFDNIQGVKGPVVITLGAARGGDYRNVDFTLNDVVRFSGRVLYRNSTIPVDGVQFIINGEKLITSKNEPLVTDAMGNFSFLVPNTSVYVQAFKEGHELDNDGYLLGTPDDKRQPNQDYVMPTVFDATTVRLVGRIAGGTRQGNLPVGLGLSENNLGDDITLVLQLEGNNTSYTFYDSENPDASSKRMAYIQRISKNSTERFIDSTEVVFERKRIVITAPSNESERGTGEFCLDLPPTKYKIVQMFSKGYSSFFNENEGYQILDLTDSIQERKIESGYDFTYCNATYNRIFRQPVTVTVTQLKNNRKVDYFGEKELVSYLYESNEDMTDTRLVEDENITIAKEKDGKIEYLLGYPVFMGGTKYTCTITAEEQYYYNNTPTSTYFERIPYTGEMLIKNGLVTDRQQTEKIRLNAQGEGVISFNAQNTTFKQTGEDALRSLAVYTDHNGRQYEAEIVKAFVTGDRVMDNMVLAMASDVDVQVVDVLRDPPGTGSSAYREKGTSYNWSYNSSSSSDNKLGIDLAGGYTSKVSTGLGFAVVTETTVAFPLPKGSINLWHTQSKSASNYTMTLNERITTSSAAMDQGAMSDVYIGTATSYKLKKAERMCLIDRYTYEDNSDKFKSGEFKVVAQSGDSLYLVIGEGVCVVPDSMSTFAYSQRYILGSLIPALSESGNRLGVKAWQDVIQQNEQDKRDCYLNISGKATLQNRQAFSGTAISHSESANSYSFSYDDGYMGGWSVGGSVGGGKKKSRGDATTYQKDGQPTTKPNDEDSLKNNPGGSLTVKVPGYYANINISYTHDSNGSHTDEFRKTYSAGTGYTLSDVSGGNFIVDIYAVHPHDSLAGNVRIGSDNVGNSDGEEYVNEAKIHSFIFVTRGGASREPWLAPDTTCVYKENGKHVQLADATLKIDNPKIYIDQPVRNNVPLDGKAVFTLRISNESEVSDKTQYIKPGGFSLKLVDSSNPNGLKLTIDGEPLTTGRSIGLKPGETMTKTLEVERGQGYDYDNVTLQLSDGTKTITDKASFSVHFQRDASPVTISSPANNWVLNTLSQTDGGRYYKPIKVTGFDTNYDFFDHVEIQYKRYTDDESQWTTLISYYPETKEFDEIYAAATGRKARMESGTIPEQHFFGENDPEEMRYDLRAVTFSRQGNGYVTRSSEVVSGIKDTRCPEVFGKAKPANGILTYDNVISLPFNEPIAYNYLDKTANFDIKGYVNSDNVNKQTSLLLKGTGSSAKTKVKRNLHGRSFTIDMMVKVRSIDAPIQSLYYQSGDPWQKESPIMFGLINGENGSWQLMSFVMDNAYISPSIAKDDIDLAGGFHHLGMSFDYVTRKMTFFIDAKEFKAESYTFKIDEFDHELLPNGYISLGFDNSDGPDFVHLDTVYKPTMNVADVRLWSRVLSLRDFVGKNGKRLNPEEKGLLAYWPLDETFGNVAHDIAGGADLYLSGTEWTYPDGLSLRLDGEGVGLSHIDKMARTGTEDYTLSFWFKSDEMPQNAVSLYSAGGNSLEEKNLGKMRIRLNKGALSIRTNDSTYVFSENVSAGEWHQTAVVTNQSLGTAALYLDGKLVGEYSAELFDGMASDTIWLGGNGFKGSIDNFSFWHMALPANYMKTIFNKEPLGDESELVMFLPFECDKKQPAGNIEIEFSPYNMVLDSNGKYSTNAVLKDYEISEETAPLAPNTGLQTLDFNWTSTDNELQLNILKNDYELNGQQVMIVVRGIEDLHGNVMKNPQMWTVYYNRNVLQWNEASRIENVVYGSGSTFKTSWTNKGGKTLTYTIESEASWLKIIDQLGSVSPLEEKTLTVSISDDLMPGEYTTYLCLTDENRLTAKLPVTVVVETTEPEWTVTKDPDYTLTMNLRGVVKNGNVYDCDARDKVAAFYNGICVGVANITPSDSKNTGYVYMNIVGIPKMNNAALSFYLWDAARGTVTTLDSDPEIRFKKDSFVGTQPSQPVVFRPSSEVIQCIEVSEGWNWISLNVKPDPAHVLDLNSLFVSNDPFTAGDRIKVVGGQNYAEYNGTEWTGNVLSMDVTPYHVYQIYMQAPAILQVKGNILTDEDRVVKITRKPNVKESWNDLPYLLDELKPISYAMADYMPGDNDAAPIGTIIKSRTQFAVAGDGNWEGSLTVMRPGVGYYVKHAGVESYDLHYIETHNSAPVRGVSSEQNNSAQLSIARESLGNMPVIAAPSASLECQQGDILVAYSNNMVAGMAELSVDTQEKRQPLFFLSVNANAGDRIHFAVIRDGKVITSGSRAVEYEPTAVIGSLQNPFIIGSDAESDNSLDNVPAFDIQGRIVSEGSVPDNAIVIKNGVKTLK